MKFSNKKNAKQVYFLKKTLKLKNAKQVYFLKKTLKLK